MQSRNLSNEKVRLRYFSPFIGLFVCFLFMPEVNAQKQDSIIAYLFPGQGSDERVFQQLQLPNQYHSQCLKYPVPLRKESLTEYALRISEQIDTSSNYIFIGMSLGGMIATELADMLNPKRVFLISSAKQRKELPFRYRFQRTIPLNKLVPKRLVKWGALLLQPLVEPDRNTEKETFKAMLKAKDAQYLKRTVNMIINWKRTSYDKNIVHIHGTKDHTLPFRNIQNAMAIEKGSHMMTLTRGKEISSIIQTQLESSGPNTDIK